MVAAREQGRQARADEQLLVAGGHDDGDPRDPVAHRTCPRRRRGARRRRGTRPAARRAPSAPGRARRPRRAGCRSSGGSSGRARARPVREQPADRPQRREQLGAGEEVPDLGEHDEVVGLAGLEQLAQDVGALALHPANLRRRARRRAGTGHLERALAEVDGGDRVGPPGEPVGELTGRAAEVEHPAVALLRERGERQRPLAPLVPGPEVPRVVVGGVHRVEGRAAHDPSSRARAATSCG